MTFAPAAHDPYRAYRDALRRRVCAVCLDGTDTSGCGLPPPERCPLEELLPHLVEAVREARGRPDHGFAAAVEARVCPHCRHRDGPGLCRLRRDGRCALTLYLPLIVEAIDEAGAA